MTEELIHLPPAKDIQEMLDAARNDVSKEIENDQELASHGQLIFQVLDIVKEKISKTDDLNKLAVKEKIGVAAHLNFLQNLLEDLFLDEDFDFDFEEDFEDEDFEEDEDKAPKKR